MKINSCLLDEEGIDMFVRGRKTCAAAVLILMVCFVAGCPPQKYSLTTLTTGQGSVGSEPASGPYSVGQQVTLTATPAANWHFDHWEGALSGSTNPTQITMDSAKTVTAVFIINQYALNVPVTGEGHVTLDPLGGSYDSGTDVTLTAAPDAGWHFDHWEGALSGNTNPAQITMDAARTVTAVFVINQYTLDVAVSGGGHVTLDPLRGTYAAGTIVTVTATPDAGWQFEHWEGAAWESTVSTQLTMNADETVTAIFSAIGRNTLTVNCTGGGTVSLDPPGGAYSAGTVVTLTPQPNSDTRFEMWGGELQGIKQPTTITMNDNKYVEAYFMPKLFANLQPSNLCAVGSTLFFMGTGPYSGRELWKSDGTFEGTGIVKDLAPVHDSPSLSYLINLNDTLYFLAGWNGYGLWKSDGTEDGTVLVADLGGSYPALAPVKVGGKLYWSATTLQGGELWSSDGTTEGTGIVKSFGPSGSNPGQLTDADGVLYFNNVSATDTFTLWKSDGTEAGTVPIYSSRWLSEIAGLNGQVFFYAGTLADDSLFTTDGTSAGTHKVRDFYFGPGDFTRSGGLLYFAAETIELYNTRVWATNGSSVYLVEEDAYRPWDLIDLNGKLLFEALYDVNSVAHCGLFASTGSGAALLKEINPTKYYGVESYHVVVGDTLYFAAENTFGGLGLWKSNGTSAGTVLVSNINPTGLGAYYLTNVNGTVFFAGQDDAHGYQLWKSDGTTAGTKPVSCPLP